MLLTLMKWYVPGMIQRKMMKDFFHLTGRAFQAEVPDLTGVSQKELLRLYAEFTKEQGELYMKSGKSVEDLAERLYQNAFDFGAHIRSILNISTKAQALTGIHLLYKSIGIDFCEAGREEFHIRSCFFSSYYTAEICELISSLDQGMAAGISGGGQLYFEERITEGKALCKGRFNEG